MKEFLVELYVSCTELNGVERRAECGQRAAVELTAAGTPVRFVRSIFVPADETRQVLFEAASIDAVREVAQRVARPFDDVAETAPSTSIGGIT